MGDSLSHLDDLLTFTDCLTKSPYLDSRIRFRIFHPEKRILNSYLLMQE